MNNDVYMLIKNLDQTIDLLKENKEINLKIDQIKAGFEHEINLEEKKILELTSDTIKKI